MNINNAHIDLWKEFRNGSREAFGQLYNYYITDLLRYGYRVTNDSQIIRDSIQDVFLHLWQARKNLSEPESIQFYLYRSLRNSILDKNKSSKKESNELLHLFEDELFETSIEEKAIAQEIEDKRISKLRHALQQLSERQQEIIQLRYYHGFSSEEISRIMEITPQSARNLLHRTLTELRKWLIFISGVIGYFSTVIKIS